jgi:hypothetical protein
MSTRTRGRSGRWFAIPSASSPSTIESRLEATRKNVEQGRIVEQPVEVLPFAKFQVVLRSEKPQYGVGSQPRIARPQEKFRTAAGREDRDLVNAFGLCQLCQGLVASAFADPEAFPYRDRSRAVIQPDRHQGGFHNRLPGKRLERNPVEALRVPMKNGRVLCLCHPVFRDLVREEIVPTAPSAELECGFSRVLRVF